MFGRGIRLTDFDIAVIGDQIHFRTPATHLAAHRLPFTGAVDRQIQLGVDVSIRGRRLQQETGAYRHGQIDGAIAIVNL